MNDPSREADIISAGDVLTDGEMEGTISAFDWSQTPLGPADAWSPALRMMVRVLLANRLRASKLTPVTGSRLPSFGSLEDKR